MLTLDIDALNAKFWSTPLSYTVANGTTHTLPARQVLVENQPDENVDEKKPWVRWTLNPGDSQQTGISPAIYTSLGTATLQVFVPKGRGTGEAQDIKEVFETAFRGWRSDDQRLRIYKMSSTKGPDKDYHQVNVTIFYESRRLT